MSAVANGLQREKDITTEDALAQAIERSDVDRRLIPGIRQLRREPCFECMGRGFVNRLVHEECPRCKGMRLEP